MSEHVPLTAEELDVLKSRCCGCERHGAELVLRCVADLEAAEQSNQELQAQLAAMTLLAEGRQDQVVQLMRQLEDGERAIVTRNILLSASASAFDQKYDRLLRVVRADDRST